MTRGSVARDQDAPVVPLRVVFLVRSLEVGGAETQVALLALHLDRARFEAVVVCFYSVGELRATLERGGVSVISLDKKGRWDLIGFTLRLIRLMRRLRPGLIHSFMGPPNILAIGLKLVLPNLRVVWGIRSSKMEFGDYDMTWRIVFAVERYLSRWADTIVANSFAGGDHLKEQRFCVRRLIVVPNGVDVERFAESAAARTKLRKEWGVASEEKLISLVARLDSKKDHETFLRAAAVLAAKAEDVRFACVGGDGRKSRDELQSLALSLGLAGRIIWEGYRADVPAVLAASDIVTSASAYGEGFPNVVAEAMAAGRPAVVTDVGDSALIVGMLGAVVEPRSPRALVAGWEQVLSEIRRGDPQAARLRRQRIVENFSHHKMVSRMASVYTGDADAGLIR